MIFTIIGWVSMFYRLLIFIGGIIFMSSLAVAYGNAEMQNGIILLKSNDVNLGINLNSPEFLINDEIVDSKTPKSIKGNLNNGLEIYYDDITLPNNGKLNVILYAKWYPKDSILRKYATYKYNGNEKIAIKEVIIDRIGLDYSPNHNSSIPQSIPIFGKGVFLGIEFPVACERIEGNIVILGHRPGKYLSNGESFDTKVAVYGLAPLGKEKEYFVEYIKNNRPFKNNLHFNYNSWWTSPVPFKEKDIIDLMEDFDKNLYKKNGVNLDSFSIDMGWSKKDDVWTVDENMFANGFETINKKSKSMKSSLGLWISPSNFYSPSSFSNEWAKENGYETLTIPWGDNQVMLCCLAGKKYADRYSELLSSVTKQYGVKQFKLDGCYLTCNESDHGHMTGVYSSESIADTIIETCKVIHEISPNTWIEPTCFGFNPSPWWLQYTNSLIGCYGDDSPPGAVPAPVYKESATTGRDMYNLQGAYYLPIPINAQEILGIVHQTDEPFMNDAVMGVLRGHAFVPLYINPKFMNDKRWVQLASLIKWAREHKEILRNTLPIEPETWAKEGIPLLKGVSKMPNDVYGYTHWNDKKNKNITVLRNPSMFKKSINISVENDLNIKKGDYSVVSIYPESRLYKERVSDSFEIVLAPYETLVISVSENNKINLQKPKQDYFVASEIKSNPVKIVYTDKNILGDNWTSSVGKADSIIEYPIDIVIENSADMADLLVCIEGQNASFVHGSEININEKEVKYEMINSASGWTATVIPYAEKWSFISVPLDKGRNIISGIVRISATDDETVLSISAVGKKVGTINKKATSKLEEPEFLLLDGITILNPTKFSDFHMNTIESNKRPIKTINGVYLDTLVPDFAQVGWGTLQYNQSILEKTISIGGDVFIRGLGAHAPSIMRYDTDGKYKRFQCYLGCDDANNATVEFIIKGDGKILWQSGYYIKDKGATFVDIDISDVKIFELISTDGGNEMNGDHIDYAMACFLY